MSDEQLRDRRVATLADPQLRDYKVVGGLDTFANRSFWPNFFSKLVARLQWNPEAIDLTPDAREWPRLPDERRRRLKTLLAGFRVGDDLVSEHIAPFADAARQGTLTSQESLMAWVFFLQRRDEQRHAALFDRIAAEVLGLPGATPAERREAARDGRGDRRGSQGTERGHQPLPHAARGGRLRRRPAHASRRPGRRRAARSVRGRAARRARRALAHRLWPALPDRDAALPRAARGSAGACRGSRRSLGRRRPGGHAAGVRAEGRPSAPRLGAHRGARGGLRTRR